jgi:formylglycine-generating enzyme required for sulfatase activity
MVQAFISAQVEARQDLAGFGAALVRVLKKEGGLVLFDGLDEVPPAKRVQVKQALVAFATLFRHCHILVTCRTHSYRADADWHLPWEGIYELAPFDPDQVDRFVSAWYGTLRRMDPARAREYASKEGTFKEAIAPGEPRRLAELARTPLLLTVMALVHTHKGELPDSRVEVFEECVDILLIHWQSLRTADSSPRSLLDELRELGVARAALYRALGEMAYEAIRAGDRHVLGGDGRALVSEGTVRKTLYRELGDAGLRVFLDYCHRANGLLLAEGVVRRIDLAPESAPEPVYSFPHLHFEEYLAARHLAQLPDFERRAAGLAGDPTWREVILFLGEYLYFDEAGSNPRQAGNLLQALCPEFAPQEESDWRRIWLAGELLCAGRAQSAGPDHHAAAKRIVARLAELLSVPDALSSPDRAAAGRALSVLGDPRPWVGVDDPQAGGNAVPERAWVWVPGTDEVTQSGRFPGFEGFKLGDGLTVETEFPDETETWPPDAPPIGIQGLCMAAYPVTVTQFRPFVDGDGYRNSAYWTKTGWGWRERNAREAPDFWDDPHWAVGNPPVVGVTWHEAVAYCGWLTARLRVAERLPQGYVLRLPTEAEWEWSARGPQARRWPWGDTWWARACNSEESGVNRTSAVGALPDGGNWCQAFDGTLSAFLRSEKRPQQRPKAVHDLAGNVWEWCSTPWQEQYPLSNISSEWRPDYLEGDEMRVFRGGSWAQNRSGCRGASRLGYIPAYWYWAWGFRCCVAPSNADY